MKVLSLSSDVNIHKLSQQILKNEPKILDKYPPKWFYGEDTDGGTQYGLIAEEVKEVKDDFCYYDNDGNLIPGATKKKLKRYKKDYIKYGSIYGKKYAVKTNYGEWDSEFTVEQLGLFIKHFYRVLRPGGTCIIFFDIWKITNLKDMLEAKRYNEKTEKLV